MSLPFQIIVWLTQPSSGASWDAFKQHQIYETYFLSVYLLKGQDIRLLKITGPASVTCHRGSADAGEILGTECVAEVSNGETARVGYHITQQFLGHSAED